MGRFDKRSKAVFKKDIYFGTKVEKFFFKMFLDSCKSKDHIEIHNHENNGVCNDGEFVSGVDTSGADYKVDMTYMEESYHGLPLEVKWVPTYGKLTLKINDLKGYIRQSAAILFIYTSKGLPLKKPKHYNFKEHSEKILSYHDCLRWGIMLPSDVKQYLDENIQNAEPIFYMGGKKGLIMDQPDFKDWFIEEKM